MRRKGAMNRKQKVAVVIGALVMVIPVLLPPWKVDPFPGLGESPVWIEHHGPAWIGSPPSVGSRAGK